MSAGLQFKSNMIAVKHKAPINLVMGYDNMDHECTEILHVT